MRVRLALLFSLLTVVSITRVVSAQDCSHFLNVIDGADTNPGTQTQPLRSFEYAFQTLPDGARVCMAAGEYHLGDDADGVILTAQKSMTFVLVPFALNTEVRFSEGRFALDLGGGTLRFESPTLPLGTATLAFGEGLLNTPESFPDATTFLHSLELLSGTLDVGMVQTRIEASVGNPSYRRSDRTAPAAAAITLGQGRLLGTPTFAEAARTFRYINGASQLDAAQLIPPPTSTLIFDTASTFTISRPMTLGTGRVDVRSGTLRFEDVVTVTSVSSQDNAVFSTHTTASLYFDEEIRVTNVEPLVLLEHNSTGTLTLPRLTLRAEARLSTTNTGALVLGQISTAGNGAARLEHQGSGLLTIGTSTTDITFRGALVSDGSIQLAGNVHLLALPSAERTLDNRSTFTVGPHRLTLSEPEGTYRNTGTLTASTGTLNIEGALDLVGGGTLPYTAISSEGVFIEATTLGGLHVVDGGHVTLNAPESIRIAGEVRLDTAGQLRWTGASTLNIEGNAFLDAGALVLQNSQTLSLGGNLYADAGTLEGAASARVTFTDLAHELAAATPFTLPISLNLSNNTLRLRGDVTLSGSTLLETSQLVLGANDVLTVEAPMTGSGSVNASAGTVRLTSGIQRFTPANIRVGELQIATTADEAVLLGGNVEVTQALHLEQGLLQAAPDLALTLEGDLTRQGGLLDFSPSTLITFNGTTTQRIQGFAAVSLPGLRVQADVETETDLTISGPLDISNGEFRLTTNQTLTLEGNISGQAGALLHAPVGTIRIAGTEQSIAGVPIEADAVVVASPVTVATTLTASSYLDLQQGTLTLSPMARLILAGDIRATGGILASSPEAVLRFVGTGSRSITAPSTWVFPTVRVESGTTTWATTSTVAGDLELAGGVFDVGTTALTLQGSLRQTAGTLVSTNASLILSHPETATLSAEQPMTWRSLTLPTGTGSVAVQMPRLDIGEQLVIGEGRTLDLKEATVRMLGAAADPLLYNDGRFTTTTGALVFNGPAQPDALHRMDGSGTFGAMVLNVRSDQEAVLLTDGAAPTLADRLTFRIGNLDLNGQTLMLSATDEQRPHLIRNLSDAIGTGGRADGGWLIDSAGGGTFNPTDVRYDLTYTGALTQTYTLDDVAYPSAVHHLTTEAVDALNTPSRFGVVFTRDVDVHGNLTVAPGSVLQLSGTTVRLHGPDATHRLGGPVTGGIVDVRGGGGLQASTPLDVSLLDTLVVNTAATFTLDRIRQFGSLRLLQGDLTLRPPSDNTQLTSSLDVEAGRLVLDGTLEIGQGGIMALTGGTLDLNDTGSVALLDGAALSIGADATLRTTVEASTFAAALHAHPTDTTHIQRPPTLPEAGTIVFRGSGQLEAASPIPHLKLDPDLSLNGSDDIFLSGDVTVSGSLIIVNGDLVLGTSTFTHDGTLWAYDTDGTGADDALGDLIQGATSQQGGTFKLTGPVEVQLGSDLNFFRAMFSIDVAPERGRVHFTSSLANPPTVRLFDEPFILSRGTVDFGIHDLFVEGNIPNALQLGDATVLHAGAPRFPVIPDKAFRDDSAFPFRDEAYGEVVLSGGDATTLQLLGMATVQNLRLNGPVALARTDEAALLKLTGRLAYGEQGHAVTLPEGSLQLAEGSTLLRRGVGQLSAPPRFLGPIHLAYDLDDGDLTGTNRRFDATTLAAGFEVPPSAIGLHSLLVLAGDAFGTRNTVQIANRLHVTDRVVLYGGTLALSDTLTFASDADLVLMGLDPDAAPQLTTAPLAPYQTVGAIDLYIGSPTHAITGSPSLWPSTAAIDSLYLDLGQQTPPQPTGFTLHAPRTIGTLVIANDHPDSGFSLAGHALNVAQDAILLGGTLSSGALATLSVGNLLQTATGTRLLGGLNVQAEGNIELDGEALNSGLQSSGNIRLGGNAGRNLSLVFTGTDQVLALNQGSEELSSLTLAQRPTDADTSPRVRLTSTVPESVSLRLNANLVLNHGVLETGRHRLVLASSGTGFQRTATEDTPSHIIGKVAHVVPAGHTAPVVFPLGTASAYTPIAFTPHTSLPTTTEVTAAYSAAAPIGLNGLPLAVDAEAPLLNLYPSYWTLSSSVDLGESLLYDVSVTTASALRNPPASRMVLRPMGRMQTPWTVLPGAPRAETNRLHLTGTSQLLRTTPWVIGIGTPQAPSQGQASLQVIHNRPAIEDSQLDVYINGQLLYDDLTFRQGSDRIALRLSGITTTTFDLALAPSNSQSVTDAFYTEAITLTNNRHHVSVALGLDDAPHWSTFNTARNAPQPDAVHVTFVQGASDVPVSTLFAFSDNTTLTTNWTFGQTATASAFSPMQHVVGVLDPATESQYVASTLNLDGLGGQSVTALLSGYATPPSAALTSRALTISIILPDGSLRLGTIVTGVEPETVTDVPAQFKVHSNYPNPFNTSTTIPFSVPEAAEITLEVFDLLGRRILAYPSTLYAPGHYALTIDAANWASGTYVYRLRAQSAGQTHQATGRMLLVK
ncbi:MAG: hypothetical protein RhofKO_09670 [Rhodothermales bacterium]